LVHVVIPQTRQGRICTAIPHCVFGDRLVKA
jgi:hypothetical protein